MTRKLLDFQANISDVAQVNPLFSTCKVRVLYTGRNRNMSIITKDAVEKALPTLKNIPIVGEFSVDGKDYKGHGGKYDADTYDYIHTTKPYGVVPESATYEWEEVGGREYLTIHGCYLWTGRYEEAFSIVEQGKGQSMEIEVTNGRWDETEEAYQIDNFIFSALCILGDDVEPAFEEANITAYSLDKDSFKQEFTQMLSELKSSLSEKEVTKMEIKKLLEKYSTTMEALTAKGLVFSEINEDELEDKIKEALDIKEEDAPQADAGTEPEVEPEVEPEAPVADEAPEADKDPEVEEDPAKVEPEVETEPEVEEPKGDEEPEVADAENKKAPLSEAKKSEIETLKLEIERLQGMVDQLEQFKLGVEKAKHEEEVQAMFTNFQLTEEDVKDLDIHAFSIEEVEDKCYAILGRKMTKNQNFSKSKDSNIHLPLGNDVKNEEDTATHYRYGDLFKNIKK